MQMPIPNLRWWITGLVFFGTVINYTAMKVTETGNGRAIRTGGLSSHRMTDSKENQRTVLT
jgi:hypothetical protein